jgi:hypothetical protein
MVASKGRKITAGDWTWVDREYEPSEPVVFRDYPALQHHGVQFWVGPGLVTAAGLRQAATDLMKLADAVAAYHAEQKPLAPFTEEDMKNPDSPFHAAAVNAYKAMRGREATDREEEAASGCGDGGRSDEDDDGPPF